METVKASSIFNGPVELGLRALILLAEAFPAPLDLQRLVILDYLLVHSGDLENGPESLHPKSPLRAGEISIRRELIESGLHLFATKGLISVITDSSGISYAAGNRAAIFLDALTSDYGYALRSRAIWAVERTRGLSNREASALLEAAIGKWKTEFLLEGLEDEV